RRARVLARLAAVAGVSAILAIGFAFYALIQSNIAKSREFAALASRKQADANWKAFSNDPKWRTVARESQKAGKFLIKRPDRIYLKAMDFSKLK
ncbi:MAG: hypothetical protein IIA54_05520, partial [Chloroflexi bacterium]|nr:hypothetical protein [Chloroflexota bacterium]